MKRFIVVILFFCLLIALCACGRWSDASIVTRNEISSSVPQTDYAKTQNIGELSSELKLSEVNNTMTSITLTASNNVFLLKLYDNDTVTAFLAQLPMTLNMSELNGNEKYFYLPDDMPSSSHQVGSINAGDLMLYGSNCLVLFYESFSTSYSYTKIGYMEDVTSLSDVLGVDSVEVTFAVGD